MVLGGCRSFLLLVTTSSKSICGHGGRFGENTKRGALLHGVPYGVPKMEYP